MEYINGRDLFYYIFPTHKQRPLELSIMISIILQLAEAIQELHSIEIIHNDIKPENIMILFEDKKPKIKLLDYGFSCFIGKDDEYLKDIKSQKHCKLGLGTSDYWIPGLHKQYTYQEKKKDKITNKNTNTDESTYIEMLKIKDWYALGLILYSFLCPKQKDNMYQDDGTVLSDEKLNKNIDDSIKSFVNNDNFIMLELIKFIIFDVRDNVLKKNNEPIFTSDSIKEQIFKYLEDLGYLKPKLLATKTLVLENTTLHNESTTEGSVKKKSIFGRLSRWMSKKKGSSIKGGYRKTLKKKYSQ
jgi:serine/threonine protein kinase